MILQKNLKTISAHTESRYGTDIVLWTWKKNIHLVIYDNPYNVQW